MQQYTCGTLQVLEVFKELGIKTVPVTLKSSPLAKAAISIILGEPMLRLAMWHTDVTGDTSGAGPSCAPLKSRLVQAALAGLHEACQLDASSPANEHASEGPT